MKSDNIKYYILAIVLSIGAILQSAALFAKSTSPSGKDAEDVESEQSMADDPSSAAYAFINMPRQDLDILTITMRKDMVLYMEADSVLRKYNVYMGESWIEDMTRDYIKVHLTDASNIAIKSLPVKGGNIFMTLYTVTADNSTADTTIKFFNTEMQELPTSKYISLPNPDDFYRFPSSMTKREKENIFNLMPFYTVEYSISPDSNILSGKLTISDYLTLEEKAKVENYLHPDLSWTWNGKKFK